MLKTNQTMPQMIAFLIGIAIPALILGRSVLGVIIGVLVLLIVIDTPFSDLRRNFVNHWKRPLGILLGVVFLACIPSIFASDAPLRSFNAPARTLGFCIIAMIVYDYLKERPQLFEVWLKYFIIASTIAVGFAFFSQFVRPEPYWFLHLKGWSAEPLGHTLKGFASLSVLIVPLLIFGAYRTRGIISLIALLSALCLLVLVWILASRASIAGFLGIIICVSLAIGIRFGSKIQVVAASGFAALSLAGSLFWLHATRYGYVAIAPDRDYFLPVWLIDFQRQTIWSKAWEIALRSPWTGRGANTINFAPGADTLLEGTHGLHVIPAHPHNWPIELFAEIGLIGLIPLVLLLLVCALQLLKNYRINANPATLAAIGIFAGYWSSGLFNFSFWAAWWQLSFILAMALAFSAPVNQHQKK